MYLQIAIFVVSSVYLFVKYIKKERFLVNEEVVLENQNESVLVINEVKEVDVSKNKLSGENSEKPICIVKPLKEPLKRCVMVFALSREKAVCWLAEMRDTPLGLSHRFGASIIEYASLNWLVPK